MKYFLLLSLSLFCINFSLYAEEHPEIDVTHYDIHIVDINFTQGTIAGWTKITLLPLKPIDTIQLDLVQLQVDSVFLNNVKVNFQSNKSGIKIPSSQTLTDTCRVSVYYHGKPFKDPSQYGGGFYIENDYAYNIGVGFAADPHNLGRAWFPCSDNFTDKATFNFFISTPKNFKAFCNGFLAFVDESESTHTFYWEIDEKIPPYLASVAVGKYASILDTIQGMTKSIPVIINTAVADSMNAVKSFSNLSSMLINYEKRLGPYQWPRIGYNTVPTVGGAMEHACNIAILSGLIDGSKKYESTIAHELSHHWFGDLVTCKDAGDMWLNEGWAVFCEYIFEEDLYGEKAYRNYVRSKHFNVLKSEHITDTGYYALYNIPHNLTYGNTVYEKGGLVTNTLRYYIGDSLFFSFLKYYLKKYEYKNASSYDLRDELSSFCAINMTDFFDGWVFAPGFPQFSIDDIQAKEMGGKYQVKVNISQRQRGSKHIWKSNRIDVLFLDKQGHRALKTLNQSGSQSTDSVLLDFNPEAALIDVNENIADATTDYFETIKTTGKKNYPNTFFSLQVSAVTDSALFHIDHHWVSLGDTNTHENSFTISKEHYWKIDGIIPDNFSASGTFSYRPDFENDLIRSTEDSLVLLYRASAKADWTILSDAQLNAGNSKTDKVGNVVVNSIKKGEYVFAYKSKSSGIENLKRNIPAFQIFPNPAEGHFNIQFTNSREGELNIYTAEGKMFLKKNISGKEQSLYLNASPGIYFISFRDRNGKTETQKLLLR